MPYISKEKRNELATPPAASSAGELNYLITKVITDYLEKLKTPANLYSPELSYEDLNTAIGALETAKLEFYRRVAVPYEDKKIKENGDVY